ncbi:MAG: EAL domain-containing response regulator [Aeromonas sp.]
MNKAPHEMIVLLAEDHDFQRKALAHQIKTLGYTQILEASDGLEALELCQQHAVDILFCDLRMPGMDGMALLRRLSVSGYRGGIILFSALDNDVVDAVLRMSKALGLQVLGCVQKPPQTEQLRTLIDSFIPKQAQVQQADGRIFGVDEVRRAIELGQLLPWYQPKVSFATGAWIGMEALARWQHPEYGLISPTCFIPIIENNGLIDKLTALIISKSLGDAKAWHDQGLNINLSINISALSLVDGGLCNVLIDQCERWGVAPQTVTLEVVESSFVQDMGKSLEELTRLRMYGFSLSIDDFGTGYSSMQQLTLLPFTELKLDRSFIDRCWSDPSRLAVIESSIQLAGKLGLKTVAEGVEDEKTWALLAQLGCDVCQGFFSARPMPSNELAAWHADWQHRAVPLLTAK